MWQQVLSSYINNIQNRSNSVVRKLVRPNFKRLAKDYFTLHRSRRTVATRLTERQIVCAVNSRKSGKSASAISSELNVTPRRIQQLYSEFCSTGSVHVPLRPGRRKSTLTQDHANLVLRT